MTKEEIKKAVENLEGVRVDAFAELVNHLGKVPGIETISIPAKDDNELATLSYLATLFEGFGCESQSIALSVRTRPDSGNYDYVIGNACGNRFFEIAHGNY